MTNYNVFNPANQKAVYFYLRIFAKACDQTNIRLKTVPTKGYIFNIHPFVWSVWSEADLLLYAFDTS